MGVLVVRSFSKRQPCKYCLDVGDMGLMMERNKRNQPQSVHPTTILSQIKNSKQIKHMKPENLNKAVELKAIIDTTKEAKVQIRKLKDKPTSSDKREVKSGSYSLNVAENSDGSGILVKLSRYWGNDRIISAIESEIDKQIVELEAMLTEL